jgi:lipoprotein-releasing system permease protein
VLCFIILGLGFTGLTIADYLFIRDALFYNYTDSPVIFTIIIIALQIAFVCLFVILFRKIRSPLFKTVFVLLGFFTILGIPVFLAILLYKIAFKKPPQIINLISAVAVIGVTAVTMVLIIVLSVFNGFDDLIKSLFNSFDPDLKVTLAEGKSFVSDSTVLKKLSEIEGVAAYSKVVEEIGLLKYGEKPYFATIKGVDENYTKINSMDSMIIDGAFTLEEKGRPYAVIGQGIAYYLQIGLKFATPIMVHVPRKNATISTNPEYAINHKFIFPSGIFTIEQERDAKYMIVPIRFAFELLEDSLSISAVEIKLSDNTKLKEIQKQVQHLFGPRFTVKSRYQQNELFYRIMKYEKWAIFMILSFILVIASFNIIGSLSMLIIEKKKDITTFQSLGADRKLIRRIFIYEGMMISFFGAILGLVLGLLICWIQIKFEIVKLQGTGSFIIDAYPVSVRMIDVIFVFLIVLAIGFLAAWYPVRFIIKRYLPEHQFIFYT